MSEQAIDTCRDIETLREECEQTATRLLALQAPVAGALRQVVASIQLVAI